MAPGNTWWSVSEQLRRGTRVSPSERASWPRLMSSRTSWTFGAFRFPSFRSTLTDDERRTKRGCRRRRFRRVDRDPDRACPARRSRVGGGLARSPFRRWPPPRRPECRRSHRAGRWPRAVAAVPGPGSCRSCRWSGAVAGSPRRPSLWARWRQPTSGIPSGTGGTCEVSSRESRPGDPARQECAPGRTAHHPHLGGSPCRPASGLAQTVSVRLPQKRAPNPVNTASALGKVGVEAASRSRGTAVRYALARTYLLNAQSIPASSPNDARAFTPCR